MFHALRVKSKDSYFKAQATIRAMAYRGAFRDLKKKEKDEKIEQITQAAKWVKFYNRRTDSFSSGLLPSVERYLQKRKIAYKIRDRRKENPLEAHRFHRVHFLDKIEARPEQIKVIQNALSKGRGILHCATNFGKTEVACAIVSEFERQTGKIPRVFFLIHRVQLVKQTMDRFKKHLGDKIPVAMIGGGKKDIPHRGVLIATTQTANIVMRRVAFDDFMEKCDILFIDEFHINKAAQAYKLVNRCDAPLRFGLSGTIDKTNEIKMKHYVGMTGPVIAEVRNKELVDLGRSAKPILRFVKVKTEKVGGNYGEAYRNGVVRNRNRNRLVISETLRYVDRGFKTLVTVARIKHGRKLARKLSKRDDTLCAFLSGSTPIWAREKTIKRFEQGKIPILIASPIFDVGIDIPEIGAWVNAAGGKGWELVLQRLGRVLRRKKGENRVYITDFADFHNEYLKEHSLARLRYYIDEDIAEMEIIS